MTEEQLQALGPALADYLDPFLFACPYTHLDTYVRGLLSDLRRKSVEPIALRAGTPVRTLQEFLQDYDWPQDELRERLQTRISTYPTLFRALYLARQRYGLCCQVR